jgi:hypothetical protein
MTILLKKTKTNQKTTTTPKKNPAFEKFFMIFEK